MRLKVTFCCFVYSHCPVSQSVVKKKNPTTYFVYYHYYYYPLLQPAHETGVQTCGRCIGLYREKDATECIIIHFIINFLNKKCCSVLLK